MYTVGHCQQKIRWLGLATHGSLPALPDVHLLPRGRDLRVLACAGGGAAAHQGGRAHAQQHMRRVQRWVSAQAQVHVMALGGGISPPLPPASAMLVAAAAVAQGVLATNTQHAAPRAQAPLRPHLPPGTLCCWPPAWPRSRCVLSARTPSAARWAVQRASTTGACCGWRCWAGRSRCVCSVQ